jgi:hypothetical protein
LRLWGTNVSFVTLRGGDRLSFLVISNHLWDFNKLTRSLQELSSVLGPHAHARPQNIAHQSLKGM